ncbi:hypothetical protein Trydic_g5346 [Trypoxylus dichotomus]
MQINILCYVMSVGSLLGVHKHFDVPYSPEGMPIELIKNSPIATSEAIARLFTSCLQGSGVPEQWKNAYVGSIHKKDNKMKCDNYRGISLTPAMCRLYGRIVRSGIEEQVKDSEEQSGYRPGRF